VKVNKDLFYKSVMDFCKKEHFEYSTDDVYKCAKKFGFFIKFSLKHEFVCEVLDEKKLFLYKLKYGF
jgi:hypothetical protein